MSMYNINSYISPTQNIEYRFKSQCPKCVNLRKKEVVWIKEKFVKLKCENCGTTFIKKLPERAFDVNGRRNYKS